MKFFVCRHVSMWGFQNRVCLSVPRLPEWRSHHSFVNISPTLTIDTSMERSSREVHHGNPKIWIFFQKSSKFEFWLVTKSWNHLSFVYISHTIVIDASMERFSRVLHHGNPKIGKISQKNSKFEFWLVTKTCTYMMTSGMHRRPFEGQHLVLVYQMSWSSCHGNTLQLICFKH